MAAGAQRSASVTAPRAPAVMRERLRALWDRRRAWIIGFLLFLLLDLVVALAVAGSAGHF